MGLLKTYKTLPGTSLLEAIVASVIFLTVFTLSLETTVRLSVRGDETETFIAMEKRLQTALQECLSVTQEYGKKEQIYPWGELTIEVTPYGTEEPLQQLILTARSPAARKRIELRRIIHRTEEKP